MWDKNVLQVIKTASVFCDLCFACIQMVDKKCMHVKQQTDEAKVCCVHEYIVVIN